MRHKLTGRQLSRNSPHRHALMRNMAGSLLRHETIHTTLPKAKELRRVVEPLITLGKRDSESNRRLAFSRLRDSAIVTKLFGDLGPRFRADGADAAGGRAGGRGGGRSRRRSRRGSQAAPRDQGAQARHGEGRASQDGRRGGTRQGEACKEAEEGRGQDRGEECSQEKAQEVNLSPPEAGRGSVASTRALKRGRQT